MSITGKTRSVAQRGFRIQRRIAITEALFWPVLLGIGALIGTAVLLTRRLRHQAASPAMAGLEPIRG